MVAVVGVEKEKEKKEEEEVNKFTLLLGCKSQYCTFVCWLDVGWCWLVLVLKNEE